MMLWMCRVMREGDVVHKTDDGLSSLKHFKDDVTVVEKGNDCGIGFEDFQDFQTRDVVEFIEKSYETRELEWMHDTGDVNKYTASSKDAGFI